jgi:hypothetical protein
VAGPTQDAEHARETLAYIRQTMESATTFTAVSGWGLVAAGGIGLVAAWVGWLAGAPTSLGVWIPAALLALCASGAGNAIKARRLRVPLWTGSFRKMVWGLTPALIAGAFLTLALVQHDRTLLPGAWLAVYGAGVTATAAFSVRALRWMGLGMLGLGAVALVQPTLGLLCAALGFGGAHAAFGLYIVYRHGG